MASTNLYEALTEPDLLEKLEISRKHAAQRLHRDAAEVSRDLRARHG